jgi:hypothetical protein
VTDYGVRLSVRVGILSPLACAPFRVVLLYTVSPLQGGRFRRPFQGFSAPRYVSTTFGLTCRNQRTALKCTASHPFLKVRAFQAKIDRHPRMPTSSGPSQGSQPVTRSIQASASGHHESALQRNPTAVASATSAVHAPVPASSPIEDGRPHVSPLEADLPDPSNFLLTRLRNIELMS